MNIHLRPAQQSDLPFLRTMLYEAVFWRANPNKPSLEKGLAYPEVSKSLKDWGAREGDTGVVATIQDEPVAAAWYRFWTDDNFTRGHIEEGIPTLVLAVHEAYRHQGIGGKMIEWLVEFSAKQSVKQISLAVSKDNFALNLYRQQGFVEHTDTGDSFLMLREI